MGIAVRGKNRKIGVNSSYLVIPRPVKAGDESTIAVGRLLLADPRGEINENDLLELLEEHIEPLYHRWRDTKRHIKKKRERGY